MILQNTQNLLQTSNKSSPEKSFSSAALKFVCKSVWQEEHLDMGSN